MQTYLYQIVSHICILKKTGVLRFTNIYVKQRNTQHKYNILEL